MFCQKKSLSLLPVFFLVFSFTGCSHKESVEKVNFEDTVDWEEPNLFPSPPLNICVGSMITPKEGYAYYKAILNYISDHLKTKVNFIDKESYTETIRLLREGKIDVAFVCGGPYVEGHDEFGLELLVAPQVEGKTIYYSYIIVHRDSPINRFEELRGKKFVFVDPISNTGKIYPLYLLKTMGETPETFFKEYIYSYAHDISIRAVAEGIVDGGAVDSLVWNYMDKSNSPFTRVTKVIKISPPYGIPPVVVRPDLKKDLKEKLKQILLNMHKDKEGKEILERMFIDKFVEIDDSNYNSIKEIKKYIEE